MLEEIAKLFVSYSDKDKIIDEDFINELKDIAIKEAGLYFFLKNINITESLIYQGYSFDSRELFINLNNLQRRYQKYEKAIYINMGLLKYLMTGIYYAMANKRRLTSENDSEKILLNLSYNLYKENLGLFKGISLKSDDNFIPINRVINVDSTVFTYYLQNYLNEYFKQDIYYMSGEYVAKTVYCLYKTKKGKIISPTEYLIDKYAPDAWKKMPFYHENKEEMHKQMKSMLTMAEILRLGLPITFSDLEEAAIIENIDKYVLVRRKD